MTAPVRLVISGASGRMGQTVARLAAADSTFIVVGGLDRDPDLEAPPGIAALTTIDGADAILSGADVVVDFSAPAFLAEVLTRRLDSLATGALVVGTTGLTTEVEGLLDRAAASLPVLTAANFSLGVNLLSILAERTAAALGPDFDVEIVEAHHRRKEDAPSGTALALGAAIATGHGVELEAVRRDGRTGRPGPRPRGEIGFHALRGGEVIGDHQVHFIGDHERIEFVHRANDRALFAVGALRAARWIVGQPPGRYSMRDVLAF